MNKNITFFLVYPYWSITYHIVEFLVHILRYMLTTMKKLNTIQELTINSEKEGNIYRDLMHKS